MIEDINNISSAHDSPAFCQITLSSAEIFLDKATDVILTMKTLLYASLVQVCVFSLVQGE